MAPEGREMERGEEMPERMEGRGVRWRRREREERERGCAQIGEGLMGCCRENGRRGHSDVIVLRRYCGF